MKIYIASGFFNEDQETIRQEMLTTCTELWHDVYSPKEDFLYVPGITSPEEVFMENLTQISKCDVVLASTEGKDMGTVWECGYAYARGIPIVYYYPHPGLFNLMLAQSARAVIKSTEELHQYLVDGTLKHIPYVGDIE